MNNESQQKAITHSANAIKSLGDSINNHALGQRKKCPLLSQQGNGTSSTSNLNLRGVGARGVNGKALARIGDNLNEKYRQPKKCPFK